MVYLVTIGLDNAELVPFLGLFAIGGFVSSLLIGVHGTTATVITWIIPETYWIIRLATCKECSHVGDDLILGTVVLILVYVFLVLPAALAGKRLSTGKWL